MRGSESYLRNAAGAPVYRGDANNFINIGGKRYELKASDFAPTIGSLEHLMHGLSLKSHTRGTWDWEIAASMYDYAQDIVRTPTLPVSGLQASAPGNVTDMRGSGWNTLALKGIGRPDVAHVVDFGVQADSAKLRTLVFAGADWIGAGSGALVSTFNGDTRLQSLYAQDTWRFAPQWKATLGAPQWRANLLASYHVGEKWTTSVGARYSGRQYGTLDNSDPHGDTYMGVSNYVVADLRVGYRIDRQWSASLGMDNLNNAKYWAFHPYTQRTVLTEMRFDL